MRSKSSTVRHDQKPYLASSSLNFLRSALPAAFFLAATFFCLDSQNLADLTFLFSFEASDEVLLGPADLAGELSKVAELSVGLQSENLEGVGDNDTLLLVVGEGDSLEDLQSTESSGALGGLVGEHASDGSPENARWSSEVDMSLSGVGVSCLVEELVELQLVSEERAGLEKSFGSDNDDSLTVEELLGNL